MRSAAVAAACRAGIVGGRLEELSLMVCAASGTPRGEGRAAIKEVGTGGPCLTVWVLTTATKFEVSTVYSVFSGGAAARNRRSALRISYLPVEGDGVLFVANLAPNVRFAHCKNACSLGNDSRPLNGSTKGDEEGGSISLFREIHNVFSPFFSRPVI